MRGEDLNANQFMALWNGSPPHAWGRLEGKWERWGRTRITPACAGKTGSTWPAPRTSRDHPRMRGEDQSAHWRLLVEFGSPPHARGRQRVRKAAHPGERITPACAGNTRRRRRRTPRPSDHPRMRGEYPTHSDKQTRDVGSPRMRGEDRVTRPRPGRSGGITPACAGKTEI